MATHTKLLSICLQMGLETSGAEKPEALPALLIGAPGSAKTEVIQAISRALSEKLGGNFPVETMACPQMAPENIAGVPVPDRERKVTDLYVLSIGKKLIEEGRGILFLDEFSSAPDTVAAACLTLVQSGMLGDHKLPPSVARVLAMNDPERATAGRPLMAPESNRVCWIPWSLDKDDWVNYMKGGPGATGDIVVLPTNWEKDFYFQSVSLVTAFINAAPNRLSVEPDPNKAGVAWPSPRSWRNATRLLAAGFSLGEKVNSNLMTAAITGCVGDTVGGEFLAFAHKLDLPDPEEVLAEGGKYVLPARDDKALCILESVAAVACYDRPDRNKRWQAACDLVETASKKRSDIVISVIQYLMNNKPEGAKVPNAAGVYFRTLNDLGLLKK
ncbi:MAG: ATPase associated with various cellular 3 [Sphingomonadales bacterium]|nr:ATPase associated with various cellular 3 [Sphingomonadales bacterium]